MMRRSCAGVLSVVLVAATVACGGSQPAAPAASAPASAPAPAAGAAAAKPAGVVALVEPVEGAMSGHIDTFHWSAVEGADSYVVKIVAVTGDRTVWESAPLTVTEAHLPATVALEPEVHTWTVTARKGSEVIATSAVQKFTITP